MQDKLKPLVEKIIRSPELHARWLNTFSYLEYVGFRKIIKSQTAENLDLETMEHAMEEGRHATYLKKLALKLGGPKFDSYAPDKLLCGSAAEDYFQTLDSSTEAALATDYSDQGLSRLTYLYVTWLVELRALSVYGFYQEALAAIGLNPPLTGLLAEEDRHLSAVEKELSERDSKFANRSQDLKNQEAALYTKFVDLLERDLHERSIKKSEQVATAHA